MLDPDILPDVQNVSRLTRDLKEASRTLSDAEASV